MRSTQVLSRLFLHTFLLVTGVLFLLPFVWMIATSLKPTRDLFTLVPNLIPSEIRWQNYLDVLDSIPFVRFYLNTILMTSGRVAGQVILCSLAAFAFARLRFPGKNILFVLLLAALMIPSQMLFIPNFIILKYFGWLDTFTGLIIPSIFSAYGTFLLRQFFMTIPSEFQEAAVLEGANPLQIYWYIFLPLAKPALSAFALLVTLWSWNDFLWPLIITNSIDMQVLSVGVAYFQGQHTVDTAAMMAAATMATIPMLLVFLVAQRQLIHGISLGGLK